MSTYNNLSTPFCWQVEVFSVLWCAMESSCMGAVFFVLAEIIFPLIRDVRYLVYYLTVLL